MKIIIKNVKNDPFKVTSTISTVQDCIFIQSALGIKNESNRLSSLLNAI